MSVLYVALGSALGGVCRYGVSQLLRSAAFPWATLCVNVAGSLAIGVLSGWLAQGSESSAAIRAFAVVGFCGGFTTFSTFSNETFRMLESGQFGMVALYVGASFLAGLASVWAGYAIMR